MSKTCIAPRGKRRTPCTNPAEPGSLFCRTHERAPAAQRGGWISAEKRRRKLASQPIDASNITPRLWIGGAPPADADLPAFDVLVLCAEEYQPQVSFRGRVIRCPIPDAQLADHQLAHVLMVARAVAAAVSAGGRVLVTCKAGLNRSALVTALALSLLTRRSADELVALIRSRRSRNALGNPHFQAILRRVAGDGRMPYRT